MTTMTFAAGWVQEIDTSDESRERADLLSYISDTHKSVYGFRPRWDREWADTTPIADLRKEANRLEADVYAEIKRERADRGTQASRNGCPSSCGVNGQEADCPYL